MKDNYSVVCLCAVRYALGRQTYMPELVQNYIRAHIGEIETEMLSVRVRDIEDADRIMEHTLPSGSVITVDGLGDTTIDRPGWLKFKTELKTEIARRGSNG